MEERHIKIGDSHLFFGLTLILRMRIIGECPELLES
jgi:hypothetical protein